MEKNKPDNSEDVESWARERMANFLKLPPEQKTGGLLDSSGKVKPELLPSDIVQLIQRIDDIFIYKYGPGSELEIARHIFWREIYYAEHDPSYEMNNVEQFPEETRPYIMQLVSLLKKIGDHNQP